MGVELTENRNMVFISMTQLVPRFYKYLLHISEVCLQWYF